MIEGIKSLFSGGPLYVRIRSTVLSVRNVADGTSYEDLPVIAIQPKPERILAFGAAALAWQGRDGVRLANGFDHPRTIIADFTVAQETLKLFIRRVLGRKLFQVSPVVIMHVLDQMDGGLTQVECRALRELALGAGAREVYLREGPELTDRQIKTVSLHKILPSE